MIDSLLLIVTDSIFLVSMLASTLMCLAASLVGVLIFLRKQSLLGEAISHAAYPGIGLAVLVQAAFFSDHLIAFPIVVMIGAGLSSYIGLRGVGFLKERLKVSSDTALCFILSTFLGLGVLFASRLQFSHPMLFQKVNMYLYGQAATLMMSHVWIYGVLTAGVIAGLIILYHPLKMVIFDRMFATVAAVKIRVLDAVIVALLLLSVLIGMRSVGVVLMAGMLIAPAATARQYVSSFSTMLVVAGFVGTISALIGCSLSIAIPIFLKEMHPDWRVVLPSGPLILIVAASICVLSLLFAPRNGWVPRGVRRVAFQLQCAQENILKGLYKESSSLDSRYSSFVLWSLWNRGLVKKSKGQWLLTEAGLVKAKRIIRLHRLWEAYLFSELGYQADRVHKNAEEMEHILTEEMEDELSKMLKHPKYDPHDQLIPGGPHDK